MVTLILIACGLFFGALIINYTENVPPPDQHYYYRNMVMWSAVFILFCIMGILKVNGFVNLSNPLS